MTILRIDADAITYTAGFAADSRGTELSHSLHNCKLMINEIINQFSPCIVSLYLTSRDNTKNFRFKEVIDYKANRIGAKKPIHYLKIRQFLIDHYGAKVCQWGEADDWLGIEPHDDLVIASKDKDLLQIPCRHYRIQDKIIIEASDPGELWLKANNKDILGYGLKWFCAQMLLGDSADNIHKPKKGFGPKAVLGLLGNLQTFKECWNQVAQFYKENQQEDLLMTNAKLLWMARKARQSFSEELLEELLNG